LEAGVTLDLRRSLAAFALAASCAGCTAFWSVREPQGVRVELRGDQSFSRKDALEIVAPDLERFAEGRGRKSDVDDAAYALEQALRERGHAEPRVEYRYDDRSEPPVATFSIAAGPRVELVAVDCARPCPIPDARLRAFFGLEGGLLGAARQPYVEDEVQAALEAIEAHLRAQGRLSARARVVGKDIVDGAATLRLAIVEGPVHRIADVEVLEPGRLPLEPGDLEALRADFVDKVAVPRAGVALIAALEELVAPRGWPDAKASIVERKVDGAAVSFVLALDPGPRVRVGAVRIEGLRHARESFVASRVRLVPGEPWSRTAEQDTASALWRSGLFTKVDLETGSAVVGDDGIEVRDLRLSLAESRSIEYSVEPGIGSYEGAFLRLGARERNLFGTGRTLSGEVHGSDKSLSGRVALLDPWTFGEAVDAELAIHGERREEPSFERGDYGASLLFTKRLSSTWSATAGVEARASILYSSQVAQEEADLVLLDELDIAELVLGASRDDRDNLYAPTEGSLTRAKLRFADRAILSEIDWVRLDFARNDAFRLSESLVLATSFRAGLVVPRGQDEEVPLQERYFNGGLNTVRSFREGLLGPKDANGEPLGGEGWSVASVEARQKVQGRLEAALFVDAGTVATDAEDWIRFESPSFGLGAGLRYMLPVGPVRLDGAWNPDPRAGESDGALHLTVGLSF
jgi:outer membrane protein assembly factor BamA